MLRLGVMNIREITLPEAPRVRTEYNLPFLNQEVDISQGYNGPYSHKALEYKFAYGKTVQDDRFSLDFALPIGTSVRAAKEGIVKFIVDGFSQYYQGLDIQKAIYFYTNHLYLVHEDGSFTLYSHLQKGSFQVKIGNYIRQGEIMAHTGLSGWIGLTPHLHFAAGIFKDNRHRETFPIQFKEYNDVLEHEELDLERVVSCI